MAPLLLGSMFTKSSLIVLGELRDALSAAGRIRVLRISGV